MFLLITDLDQRSENYGLQAKSGPLPVVVFFVNKSLLEHSYSIIYILCMTHLALSRQS